MKESSVFVSASRQRRRFCVLRMAACSQRVSELRKCGGTSKHLGGTDKEPISPACFLM